MKRINYICPICQKEQETTEWRFKRKKNNFLQKLRNNWNPKRH